MFACWWYDSTVVNKRKAAEASVAEERKWLAGLSPQSRRYFERRRRLLAAGVVGRREWRGMRDWAPWENGPVRVRRAGPKVRP
jgi:hypothetical protein